MEHVVHAAKCKRCGKVSYPSHFFCPACGSAEFSEVAIEGEGTLLTWTRAHALPLDYETLFITLGIVELDMGVRATGQLDIAEPETGMRVRATVGPVRNMDGRTQHGLRFVAR